jgi:type VI protein secretion system component Hcp
MALDMFLKIDSLNGTVTQKGYEHSIAVTSFSWGETTEYNPVTGETGQPQVGGLTLVSATSLASPKIALAGFAATHFQSATLTVIGHKPSGQAFKELFIKLDDAFVSSFSFQGADHTTLTDRFVLEFVKADITTYSANSGTSTQVTIDQRQLG